MQNTTIQSAHPWTLKIKVLKDDIIHQRPNDQFVFRYPGKVWSKTSLILVKCEPKQDHKREVQVQTISLKVCNYAPFSAITASQFSYDLTVFEIIPASSSVLSSLCPVAHFTFWVTLVSVNVFGQIKFNLRDERQLSPQCMCTARRRFLSF